MAVVDARGLPIGLRVFSAGEHEVRQAQETLFSCWSGYLPERVIADRGFDSDALDASPADLGVDMIHARVGMIVPHRKNRKLRTRDGRKLRRYRRRWKVERLFAWLGNFRRLLVRHDRKLKNFEAFAHLATIVILVRSCF